METKYFIKKQNDTWINPATGNKLAPSTAKRYKMFYRKNPKNTPLLVARGGRDRLLEQVKSAERENKRIVRLSPVGPVRVTLRNGKLHYRKEMRAHPVLVRKPKKMPPIAPPRVILPAEPEIPVSKVTPEANLAKFGFAIERHLRQYAILDLKNNPDKFGKDQSIEYKELYSSQQELWSALKGAQRSDTIGLRIGGNDAPSLSQTNVIAEFLDIPKWKSKQIYFSDEKKDEILRRLRPITKREVNGFNPYSHIKRRNRSDG